MHILWIRKSYFDQQDHSITKVEMVRALKALGHEVILLTGYKNEKRDYDLQNSIKFVFSVKMPVLHTLTFILSAYLYLIFYTLKRRPGVVILCPWTFWLSFPLDLLSKWQFIKTKFIIDVRTLCYHEDLPGLGNRLKKWYTLKFAMNYNKKFHSGISVITEEMRDKFISEFGLDKSNISLWRPVASLEKFNPDNTDINYIPKQIQSVLQKKFVIMYHGTLEFDRGLLETIAAISSLKSDFPDLLFIMLGDGPLMSEVLSQVKERQLENYVLYLGRVAHAEVPGYIKLADVGILAFPETEFIRVSNPIKLMEYLAMEKPVIITDIPAYRRIIEKHDCGISIDSNEPLVIAEAIRYTYEHRTEISEMGKAGRKVIEEKGYTWERQARTLASFLEKL